MSRSQLPPGRGAAERPTTGGDSLDPMVQARMERSFGHDFSAVRIHQDGAAAGLGAHAFAEGNHLHFAPGRYDPHSAAGQELLGHELAHVVQQARGRVTPSTQCKGLPVNRDAALEREADEAGTRAARGEAAGIAGSPGGGGGGDVIQGKDLEQAGLAGGVHLESTRGLVGTDTRTVGLYVRTRSPVDGKDAAFRAVAQANAELAGAVDDHARDVWGIRESNAKWTDVGEPLKDDTLRKIDPFFLTVVAPFRTETGVERLELTHQHAKQWTGYVEAIRDTSNPSTQGIPSMYVKRGEDPQTIDTSQGRNPQFSNVHDTTDNNTLLDLTNGGEEKNFDAYTKIAGEGARFRCVRHHTSRLRNTTRFYYKRHRRDRVRAVTFVTLWKSWKDLFGKRYDISDGEILRALRDQRFGNQTEHDLTQMTDDDYRLQED